MCIRDRVYISHPTENGTIYSKSELQELYATCKELGLDVYKRQDELLQTLGLYEHRKKLPNQLSGGQQQRTAIGRAIVKNPDRCV